MIKVFRVLAVYELLSYSFAMGTILVVEDYDDVRRMLKVLLESEKFRVLEAATGSEALDVIKHQRPDIILMDLALPGFDGFETIRRIRAIDGFQNTPIIVLTAYTGPSTYENAVRAGSNYFMAKPIDFDELAALLEEILSNRNRRNTRPPCQRAVPTTKPPAPHHGCEPESRI
jgi:CheY-like chemotaxis protein